MAGLFLLFRKTIISFQEERTKRYFNPNLGLSRCSSYFLESPARMVDDKRNVYSSAISEKPRIVLAIFGFPIVAELQTFPPIFFSNLICDLICFHIMCRVEVGGREST